MSKRRTERLHASAILNGDTALTAAASLHEAVLNLASVGDREDRLVLFDTLDVSIERGGVDDRTFSELSSIVATRIVINVSAEAVKLGSLSNLAPVSETETS
jgi:hypothetical protein